VLALSVLTTKQHYAIDILGGLVTATVGTILGSRLARRFGIAERWA
jgi:membrane-associated phospholipid phosphatase